MELREEFRRQRRNTIAISLVLYLYVRASVTLDKIVLFGNTFDISNPDAVPTVLWLAWTYFTVRMLQFMHDLGDLGFAKLYHERLGQLVPRIAFEKFRAEYDQQQFGDEYGPLNFTFSEPSVLSAHPSQWEVQFTSSVNARKLDGNGIASTGGSEVTRIVEARDMRLAKARSLLHVAVKTHLLGEYAFPILMAASPLFHVAAARFLADG